MLSSISKTTLHSRKGNLVITGLLHSTALSGNVTPSSQVPWLSRDSWAMPADPRHRRHPLFSSSINLFPFGCSDLSHSHRYFESLLKG